MHNIILRLRGVMVPNCNDSLVDIAMDDVMYTSPEAMCCRDLPSNINLRDEALLCVTDLIDCCESPHKVRGDWYYPHRL